ncbi:hypothetical protein C0J52_00018, partial [Blattella germanica]
DITGERHAGHEATCHFLKLCWYLLIAGSAPAQQEGNSTADQAEHPPRMTPFALLKLCILTLQFLDIDSDSNVHHPQFARLSLLRDEPTSKETVLDTKSLSCSQTVDVAHASDQFYRFVVPQNNSANLYCVITIYGQRGKQLLLQLTEVNLPPGIFDCEFDAVQIYSLNDGKLSFKEKFCNLSQPSAEILTDKNVALITFNAGSQPYEQGFRVHVQPVVLTPDHSGQIEEGSHEELSSGYEYGGIHYPYYPNSTRPYIPPNAYQPIEFYNVSKTEYGPPISTDIHYGPPLPTNPPNAHYGIPPRPEYGPPKPDNPKPQYGYKPPSNSYGPPTGYPTRPNPYQTDCNDQPWSIIDKPGVHNYDTNQPTKTRFNQDFYAWLTSATTGNKWSKEIPSVKRSLLL